MLRENCISEDFKIFISAKNDTAKKVVVKNIYKNLYVLVTNGS